jgi:hypothetical protein
MDRVSESVENEKPESIQGLGSGADTSLVLYAPRDIEGSRPLPNRKHERFCWLIAQLRPKGDAYRQSGFVAKDEHTADGNAARLLRRHDIQDRVAYLSRQEEEILQAKRRRIEEFLWSVHEANLADLWETVEVEKRDKKGNVVYGDDGKTPIMVKRQQPRPLSELPDDVQRVVETCQVDEHGRVIPKPYSKMQANQELRKLLNIGAAMRDDGELARLSDAELVAELSRQAKELGVEIDLSYRFGARCEQ